MTNRAAEQFCLAAGITALPPHTPPKQRPYWLLWRRAADDQAQAEFAVGELLGEAVLAWQAGRTRRVELRSLAPELCHASGGEQV